MLERSIRYPQNFLADKQSSQSRELLRSQLLSVCRAWSEPLHEMSNRTDTHDIGFIVEPALRRDFELTGDSRSLESIVRAANNLASRYSETTKAIRSWDTFVNNRHRYTSKEKDFLVIIDSMCSEWLNQPPIWLLTPFWLTGIGRLGSSLLRRTSRSGPASN